VFLSPKEIDLHAAVGTVRLSDCGLEQVEAPVIDAQCLSDAVE
jgi:hypothetical protein